MDAVEIRRLIALLDTRDARQEEAAWTELRPLEEVVVPFLLELYPRCRTWQGRVALVFHSIRFARTSDAAFELGLLALGDRSFMVRYRACGLLAYSQRAEALAPLRELLTHADQRTVEDARAALDALTNGNHHLFIDRTHTGRAFWSVNPGDRDP